MSACFCCTMPAILKQGVPPFGTACSYVFTSVLATTTSTTTYINHLTLVTGFNQTGDYFVGGWAYYSQDAAVEGDCQIQVLLDGVEVINNRGHSNGSGILAQSAKNHFGGATISNLSAGTHTIDLNFRVGTPSDVGDAAAMFWSSIELWSFN